MKMLTQALIKKIPPLYTHEKSHPEDVPVVVKFFTPWSNWTWYVTEGEKQENGDWYFFGYVKGFANELGYFLLSELTGVTGPAGLKIERDIHFEGKTLADIMD